MSASASAPLSALSQQAHALASGSLAANERFAQLERLRAQALTRSLEQRKHYAGRPIPFAEDERKAWEEHVGMWQAFYIAYALCADVSGETQVVALVWQRALDCLGRAIREHAQAYRGIPPALWKELHRCYASAEACGLDDVPVESGTAASRLSSSCRSIYLMTILHDAANLYSVDPDQLDACERLLPSLLQDVRLMAAPPEASNRSPLIVDLDSECGAHVHRDAAAKKTVRFLETGALSTRLRDLATNLRAGNMPAELAAAAALPRAKLERLLTHLYVQWCSAGSGRTDDRRATTQRAQVAVTMHAVHFQVSGRAFRQPGLRYTREEEHDLATFGHITERTEHRLLTARSSALEPWEVINQSASGALGMLRKPDLTTHIVHGQLIAFRTSSAAPAVVGYVQRLKIEQDGTVHVGVRLMHGDARGIAARPIGDPTQKYQRALIIEADPERGTSASLIAPPGLAVPGAALEIYSSRAETIMVNAMLNCSASHEQFSFSKTQ